MKKYRFLVTLIAILVLLFAFQLTVFANNGEHEIINEETTEKINEFKAEIGSIINIALAFISVTSVLIFIIHFIRLANAYDHPLFRRKVMEDISTSAIVTALIGGIGLVSKIFIGMYM